MAIWHARQSQKLRVRANGAVVATADRGAAQRRFAFAWGAQCDAGERIE